MTQFDRDNRQYAEQLAEQMGRVRKTNKEIAREEAAKKATMPTTPAGRMMVAVGSCKIGDVIGGKMVTGFGRDWRMDSDDDRVYQVYGSPEAGTGSFSVCYAYLAA